MSNKISSVGKKINKNFIDYLYNDNEIKPLYTMLSEKSTYIKGIDVQTEQMYFFN